jgi:DNA-binding MarR family transcriptional regulator
MAALSFSRNNDGDIITADPRGRGNGDLDMTCHRMMAILEAIQEETAEDVNLMGVRTFLAAALENGGTVTEIARRLNQSRSTTSRHLLDFGPQTRIREPGYQLLEGEGDPMDRRIRCYRLTAKGKDLLARLGSYLAK